MEVEKEEPLERRHAEVRESSRRKEEAGGRRMEGGRNRIEDREERAKARS